jgi:hypothetical protein
MDYLMCCEMLCSVVLPSVSISEQEHQRKTIRTRPNKRRRQERRKMDRNTEGIGE